MTGEGFLVRVCGPKATVTVGDLTGDACLHSISRRVLLTELASNSLTRHGGAWPVSPLPTALTWRIGPTDRSLLEAINNVLQGHIPLEAIQAPVIQRDNIPACRTLKSSNGWMRRSPSCRGGARVETDGAGEQEGENESRL